MLLLVLSEFLLTLISGCLAPLQSLLHSMSLESRNRLLALAIMHAATQHIQSTIPKMDIRVMKSVECAANSELLLELFSLANV